MSVVVFDYGTWAIRFPKFTGVSPELAQMFFDEAALYLSNSDRSIVTNPVRRAMMLNLITAHIAALNGYDNGKPGTGSPFVGRVSSVTEGSVSISSDYSAGGSPSRAWWDQTRYGAMVWQMLAPYRTMRYIPGPQPNYNGNTPGMLIPGVRRNGDY